MKTTTDSILRKDILINQPIEGFRFSMDSILLSRFVKPKKYKNILDIGSGSGIIAILLAKLYDFKNITALEYQLEMFDCLLNTVELNNLTSIIKTIKEDIKKYKPDCHFDMIISNPPYRKKNSGRNCLTEIENIARFDDEMSLDDICKFAGSYLLNAGYLYFSYDADLVVKAINICKSYNLEPKRIRFLHPDINKPAKLVFVECRKNGKTEVIIEPPLFQKINGAETKEFSDYFQI